MHLKSMKVWILAYLIATVFDVGLTFLFISQPEFGIESETNAVIRTLMERYGIGQGLTIYVIQ
jgi:hypothetical protein